MDTQQPPFLQLETERMREIGHLTIDALVDEMARSAAQPVVREASVDELRRRLREPPPDRGLAYEDVLDRVFTDVTPYRGRPDAAGYLAFVPGFTTWPSAMADLIASALISTAAGGPGAPG